MRHPFLKLLFRVALAVAIGYVGAWLFRAVLPVRVADAVGLVVGGVELAGFLVTAKSGAGHGFRLMLRLGEVVLSWPLAALALRYAGLTDRPERIGLAAAVSAAGGLLGQRHGAGHETRRLMGVMAATAIPAYAVFVAIRSGDTDALIAACVAVAVALGTVRATQVLPGGHRDAIVVAAGVVVCAGLVAVARTLA